MTCFERRPKNMIDYVILKVYGAFGMYGIASRDLQ